MKSDLRSTLQRLAPSPKRRLDVSALVQQGQQRRRTRYLAYAATTVAITIVAATAFPAVFRDRESDQQVGPVQTPPDGSRPIVREPLVSHHPTPPTATRSPETGSWTYSLTSEPPATIR